MSKEAPNVSKKNFPTLISCFRSQDFDSNFLLWPCRLSQASLLKIYLGSVLHQNPDEVTCTLKTRGPDRAPKNLVESHKVQLWKNQRTPGGGGKREGGGNLTRRPPTQNSSRPPSSIFILVSRTTKSLRNAQTFPQLTSSETAFGTPQKNSSEGLEKWFPTGEALLFGTFCSAV